MLRRLFKTGAGLALLLAPAFADSQFIGAAKMYLCDGGEDLCSNTIKSSPVFLPYGSFKEDFVFDLANPFVDVPDNIPLLKAQAFLRASGQPELSSAIVQLYNSAQAPIGIIGPGLGSFVGPIVGPLGTYYKAQSEALIHSGTDLLFEVTGFANVGGLPLDVSISAFDLVSVVPVMPEPSTWTITLLGFVGLGFAGFRRASRAR